MRNVSFLLAIAICSILLAQPLRAQDGWRDGFEDYALGGIHGQGGWNGWDGDPAFDALVTDAQAFDGTQSLLITGAADIVQQFSGYTSGRWALMARTWVPSEGAGAPYLVMLTDYTEGGPYHWTVQCRFDPVLGVIQDEFTEDTLPLITDQWVRLIVDIDLDNDTKEIYYGDQMLSSSTWTCAGCGDQEQGPLNIAAVDLYAGVDPGTMFFDELVLAEVFYCVGTGDANCDGLVNGFDIDPFVLALTDPILWELTYPCDLLCSNDMNADGFVNGFDIDPFVDVLVGEPKTKYCVYKITKVVPDDCTTCWPVGEEVCYSGELCPDGVEDCSDEGTKKEATRPCPGSGGNLLKSCTYTIESLHICTSNCE